MSDVENARIALIKRVLEGDGNAARATRKAAFDGRGLSGTSQMLIDKIANDAYQITDEDIAAVKASGLNEDEVFELAVCAAIGQAARQYDAARAALRAVAGKGSHAASGSR